MFYKQKSNIIFRNYNSFGYITDNRNFGYKRTDDDKNHIGDKILSESGAIFFSVLDRKPQNLDVLAEKIAKQFIDIDINTIKEDARDFYCLLEQDGFIVSGETDLECEEKDTRFSYKMLESAYKRKGTSLDILQPRKSTQDFIEEHFNGKPQLTNIHIEITSKCNERCIHCYIPHENKINNIDSALFYDILQQCKDMNLLHLTLSGGEPMLHKTFVILLESVENMTFQ